MHEHKSDTRGHSPLSPSLISVHQDQEGHKFDLDKVKIIDQATTSILHTSQWWTHRIGPRIQSDEDQAVQLGKTRESNHTDVQSRA